MVTLEKIREDLRKELQKDSDLNYVEVRADTLEEALADAGVQLDTSTKNLEYEVQEKGSAGMFGLAKKPWKIRVYQTAEAIEKKKMQQAAAAGVAAGENVEEENKIVDKDGVFFVHHFGSDIYLKVVLPVGNGRPVELSEVMDAARRSDTLSLEEADIKKFVAEGTNGEYESIGMYSHVQSADAVAIVDIASDKTIATVTVTPPAVSGAELSIEQFKKLLIQYDVSEPCIEIDKIVEFVDNPVYNVPYEMAAERKAINGADAYMKYEFETDTKNHRMTENEKGQVNFKELNLIDNVVVGQLLATKIDAERGQGGKKVNGDYIDATNGKDFNIQNVLGKNVKLEADGHSVVATVDGQVSLQNGKITVEPVVIYEKGINAKTGNVQFVGNVIVNGNVEDGFDIKADGNVEINGGVGNCKITAGGYIFITQGVMGRNEGVLVAGKSIWAKFINSTKVEAGEHVLVSDSIMTSEVTAMKRIILRGKRAQITGGHLFATEEIAAKNLGNEGGTETIMEVGIDPKAKQRQLQLQTEQNALIKELEDVDLNINTLEMNKRNMRKLPVEKEEKLNELTERKNQIIAQSDEINAELEQISERLRELKAIGKVKASGTVYPGTTIYVRDIKEAVTTEVKAVTFFYENGFVKRGKYENPTVEDIEAPEGYSGM